MRFKCSGDGYGFHEACSFETEFERNALRHFEETTHAVDDTLSIENSEVEALEANPDLSDDEVAILAMGFQGPRYAWHPRGEPRVDLGDRESIIAWLAWNDGNATVTDEDSDAEGQDRLTLEDARAILRDMLTAD